MRTALCVALLLVTAGCLGTAAPDTSTTDTTASTTDTTTTAPDDGFPPGVDEAGVENASALVDAHRSALAATGYAFRAASTTVHGDSENATTTYTGRTTGEEARIHVESQRDGDEFTGDLWWNESVQLTRAENGDDVRFGEQRRRPSYPRYEPFTDQIATALAAGDFSVAERYAEDGRTYLVLEADEPRADADGQYESVTARAVVDLDGRVHEFDGTLEYASDSGAWTHRLEFEVTELGVESVERPDWAERALATVSADLSLDSGRDHVTLEHRGGDTLPAGTTVNVTHAGESHVLTFDQSLAEGERAYFAFPADGGAPVLAFEEPSGDFARIDGEYGVTVTGPDGERILSAGFAVGSATASGGEGDSGSDGESSSGDASSGSGSSSGSSGGSSTSDAETTTESDSA